MHRCLFCNSFCYLSTQDIFLLKLEWLFLCRSFKSSSTPSGISKGAPDFCTVYVISKGKISSVRNASRAAPHTSPLLNHIHNNLTSEDVNQPAEKICSRRMNMRGLFAYVN